MGIFDFFKGKNNSAEDERDLSVNPLQIVRKARGSEIPRNKQRIFLCWHPENEVVRDILLKDLLSHDAGVNCVISYIEMPGKNKNEEFLRQELDETQLMVLIVSREFLVQAKKEKSTEYHIAKEIKLPVLPVALDSGILPEFTKQEGAIHCLAITDPEYRNKLKMQLGNFIISDELMQEIMNKAFTVSIFLSYRKKDLALARQFMKNLHNICGLESVLVWYDNFLTAGRVFDEEIRATISNADLFVLLVTQNITESGNYVLQEEYPYAKNEGKCIMAVEMQKPEADFNRKYPHIDYYAKPENLESVFQSALPENIFRRYADPEHSYLLGMAFLNGIIVERDYDLAMDLLTAAAGKDYLRAVKQLGDIHFNKLEYQEALQIYERAVMISEKASGMQSAQTAELYICVAECHLQSGNFNAGWEMYKMAQIVYMNVSGMESLSMIKATIKQGWLYSNAKDFEQALDMFYLALDLAEKLVGPESEELVEIYDGIAFVYLNVHDYEQAQQMYLKSLTICEKFFGTDHPYTVITYNHIANTRNNLGDYSQAMEMCKKGLSGCRKLFGEEHPRTANSYLTMGEIYFHTGDFVSATGKLLKAYKIHLYTLGRSHTLTEKSYFRLYTVYALSDKQEDFNVWLDKVLYK